VLCIIQSVWLEGTEQYCASCNNRVSSGCCWIDANCYVVVGMMVCACKLKMGTEKIAKEILLTGCDPSWSTFLRYCNISKKLPYSPGHKHHRGISNIG